MRNEDFAVHVRRRRFVSKIICEGVVGGGCNGNQSVFMKKVVSKKCSCCYAKRKRDVSGITPSSVANDAVGKTKRYEHNHKNYNFLDCDWLKKLLFFTNLSC